MSIRTPYPASFTIPFRARLARFDRPANARSELIAADGSDFIHFASWSVLGRRPSREEHDEWLGWLTNSEEGSKDALIAYLVAKAESTGISPPLAGLVQYVRIRDFHRIPVFGFLAAAAANFYMGHSILSAPVRFSRSIPGKCRWTYRHSRKGLIKFAKWINLPVSSEVKRALGVVRAPAPEDTPAQTAEYYRLLCMAIDGTEVTH